MFDQNLNSLSLTSNEKEDSLLADFNENEVDIVYLEETPIIHKEKDTSFTSKTDPILTISRKIQSAFDELETEILAMKLNFVDELENL